MDAGLEKRLNEINTKAVIRKIDIPEGNNEQEIWEIFEIVYNTLEEDDEIIFDITHSFRYIPMLFMVLIGYARLLKKISVAGIYYGAFEVLGGYNQVKEMHEEKREAPIFDLTSFEQLIEWTEAAQNFIKNGIADDFARLAREKINPVLKDSHGKDQAASDMRNIIINIEKISRNIFVNRGADIINFNYDHIKKPLQSLQENDIFIKPMKPLMAVIEKKIDTFAQNDIENGFRAVEWSVEHGLYQQAVTMLQENTFTMILARENMEWGLEKNRHAISKAFKIKALKMENPDFTDDEERQLVARLLKNPVVIECHGLFERLTRLRNDLNHGGYLTEKNKKAKSSESIRDQFQTIYSAIKDVLKWDD